MDDASRAVLALTNRLVDVGAAPLKASELWGVVDRAGDPASLVGRTAAELSADLEVDASEGTRLATLLDVGVALTVRLDALHEQGIWTSTPFGPGDSEASPRYPAVLRERLGRFAPPVLYGAGAGALLSSSGVGVVGSRQIGDASTTVARDVASRAVAHGRTVMSGGSPGVDQVAMAAAVDGGGAAVGVLADSLEAAIARADARRHLMAGRLCLCTPYRPDVRRTLATAAGRNKIVYALSEVTVVVTSGDDDRDGTWTGASEALAHGYGPVAVWRGAGEAPGNEALATAGARPITDLADLFPPAAG